MKWQYRHYIDYMEYALIEWDIEMQYAAWEEREIERSKKGAR